MFITIATMFSDTWLAILTLCCIAYASWVFISFLTRINPPLPPGPLGLPVVGSLPFLHPELHTYFANLTKTYGPLVTLRLGKKIGIVVGSPSMAKQILKEYDVTFANRDVPAAGREATYGGVDIGWLPYGPEWRMVRKVCVREMLSSTTLNAMYGLRKHEISQTMQSLKERSGSAVNIGDEMFITAMNVVTNMLWGATVKGEQRAEFQAVVLEITSLLGVPNMSDFFPALKRFDLQGIMKKMKKCVKKLDGIFEEAIERRGKMEASGENETKDFLQVLLDLKDSNHGDSKVPFTMVHLKALFMDMVTGGTDTTSSTLTFAMAELVNNPEMLKKAQQELDTVVGLSNDPLEEAHTLHLPYLQAIMKETLRLYPILPLLLPHSPSQSCVVGDYTIPKGSSVFVNVWAIQRDPLIWKDPLEFKPERFMDGEKSLDFGGSDFSYLPFGSGRRTCTGLAMAGRMVLYSLGSLLHGFDWELPNGVEKVDLDEKFGFTLKLKKPLLLIPRPRSV